MDLSFSNSKAHYGRSNLLWLYLACLNAVGLICKDHCGLSMSCFIPTIPGSTRCCSEGVCVYVFRPMKALAVPQRDSVWSEPVFYSAPSTSA